MFETCYDEPMTKDCAPPFNLPEWIALAPFEEFLGMHIHEVGHGQAVLTMPFRAALCQGAGLMHGGAIVSLADTALAMAIKSLLPEGTPFVTIRMGLEFHAPVRWGILTANASVRERKERDIEGEVELVTEEGIRAATFRATFRVKRRRNAS
jgi:uncharacterized protein (TIGR00369 family)